MIAIDYTKITKIETYNETDTELKWFDYSPAVYKKRLFGKKLIQPEVEEGWGKCSVEDYEFRYHYYEWTTPSRQSTEVLENLSNFIRRGDKWFRKSQIVVYFKESNEGFCFDNEELMDLQVKRILSLAPNLLVINTKKD